MCGFKPAWKLIEPGSYGISSLGRGRSGAAVTAVPAVPAVKGGTAGDFLLPAQNSSLTASSR